MSEDMRPIPSAPGYFATADGRIFSARQGKLRERRVAGKRYKMTMLRVNGKPRNFSVHRAVCEAFHGPCPPDHQVRHLDNNPHNNNASNLAWGTRVENMADKHSNGTWPIGGNNPRSLVDEADVIAIRARAAAGETQTDIAPDFGLAAVTVSQIVMGDTWSHVPMPDMSGRVTRDGENQCHAKLTWAKVAEIRAARANGARLRALAKQYGVGQSTISSVVNRLTWKKAA